jgi:hypothetical protein
MNGLATSTDLSRRLSHLQLYKPLVANGISTSIVALFPHLRQLSIQGGLTRELKLLGTLKYLVHLQLDTPLAAFGNVIGGLDQVGALFRSVYGGINLLCRIHAGYSSACIWLASLSSPSHINIF